MDFPSVLQHSWNFLSECPVPSSASYVQRTETAKGKKKITHVRLRSIAAFKEDKPTKDWINTDMSCKTEKQQQIRRV